MELTTRGRYAVTAMTDLAISSGGAAVPLSAVAERRAISLAYLEQLFVALRRAGLVESARGRSGGYRLARAARDITIAEIMAAVEEGTTMTRCGDAAVGCTGQTRCLTHGLWQALGEEIADFLENVTLEDVAAGGPLSRPARAAPARVVKRGSLERRAG